jgi:hypothetical protein
VRLRILAATVIVIATSVSALAAEFRTIDGRGNNLLRESQGAAGTRVIRFGYSADYPDGVGDVITVPGKPNPRDVSNTVNAQTTSNENNRGLSDWIVEWGQFLTHDISLVATGATNNLLSTGAPADFSISINDPHDILWPVPIRFNRSDYDPTTGNGDVIMTDRGPVAVPRWQINANTSYIDASHVYGSSATAAAAIRTFTGGKLATSAGGLLPPVDANGKFIAGDIRANENTALSATHALFVREHNRLAEQIKSRDPTLSDEGIYEWARKIVGAEIQAITYREYLPALLGGDAPMAADYSYDEAVDASITTTFAAAAFRYGHSMQSPQIQLVDDEGVKVGEIPLSAATAPNAILQDNPANVGLVLKGLAAQVAQENDAYIVDELRNIVFGPPGAGGTDLAAVDIQRGRDHGLINNYRQLRVAYNLAPLSQYDQLTSDMSLQIALQAVYGSIDNLDAWVAMIAEDHVDGSSLGRLAHSIVRSQFERLRDGDRFFFSGDPDLQSPLVTSIIDVDAITLGQLIELNTGMTGLQDNVFFAVAAVPEPTTNVLFIAWVLMAGMAARRFSRGAVGQFQCH